MIVETVIDVGVQRDSPDLRELFRNTQQILFEPATEYHESIRENYEGLSYTLEGIALSDRSGPLHLRDVRSDANGIVSYVAPTDEVGSSARLVQRSTLDDYLDVHPTAKPY